MFSLSVIYVLLVGVYVLPVRKSMFSLLENCVLLVLFVCSPYTTRRTWTINWPFLRVLRAFLVFLDPISSSTFKPKSKKYNFERENMGEHTRSCRSCYGDGVFVLTVINVFKKCPYVYVYTNNKENICSLYENVRIRTIFPQNIYHICLE